MTQVLLEASKWLLFDSRLVIKWSVRQFFATFIELLNGGLTTKPEHENDFYPSAKIGYYFYYDS